MDETRIERFDQFMARALHDPQHGYYARHIRAIGHRGDFTTAPMMDALLGRVIASWATAKIKATGCRHLIEIGPGQGVLAQQVLRNLPWQLRWRIQLHLVEQSEVLTTMQKERLGPRLGRPVRWHRSPADALDACGGAAVMFSNELVDAFPVRRFRLTPDGWMELWVQSGNPKSPPEEVLRPIEDQPDSSVFEQSMFAVGQEVEVHAAYHEWLREWLPLWRRGAMLTIDYGAEMPQLYHRKPRGTIRAYWLHQCLTGPEVLLRVGHQDLTADVNFTDLQRWIHVPQRLSTLRDWVRAWAPSAPPAHPLIAPFGPGDAFLALEHDQGAT